MIKSENMAPDSPSNPSTTSHARNITCRWQQALRQAQSTLGQSAFRIVNSLAPTGLIKRRSHLPLFNQIVSVKDLFDVQGQVTAAGSILLQDNHAAATHAEAVRRLSCAGAHLIGRTHMVEFAFSGLGLNPHFQPIFSVDAFHKNGNTFYRTLDKNFVSGGSSSGAALSIAIGAADIGLGTDTGGSIRIPAAFNGLVGFKCSQSHIPRKGMFALSQTLDTVGSITRNVPQALRAHAVMAARTIIRSPAPLPTWRLAVVENFFLQNSDATTREAFSRSIQYLKDAGALIQSIEIPILEEITTASTFGSFPAAESYAWHQTHLQKNAHLYDPRVRSRIEKGAIMSANDYLQLIAWRAHWQQRLQAQLSSYDAIISPTVAITAPLYQKVANPSADDDLFTKLNALILRNTTVVNLLDGCAISLPCHTASEKPVGLMIWHTNQRDDTILNLALLMERVLNQHLLETSPV